MEEQISCGIIPVRRSQWGWDVLLVQLHAGHWGFPKGHLESGEEPLETAIRELREETGLEVVRFISETQYFEKYHFWRKREAIHKQVIYYLAEVSGELNLQAEEIKAAKWVPLSRVVQEVTYKATKQLAEEIAALLENL